MLVSHIKWNWYTGLSSILSSSSIRVVFHILTDHQSAIRFEASRHPNGMGRVYSIKSEITVYAKPFLLITRDNYLLRQRHTISRGVPIWCPASGCLQQILLVSRWGLRSLNVANLEAHAVGLAWYSSSLCNIIVPPHNDTFSSSRYCRCGSCLAAVRCL